MCKYIYIHTHLICIGYINGIYCTYIVFAYVCTVDNIGNQQLHSVDFRAMPLPPSQAQSSVAHKLSAIGHCELRRINKHCRPPGQPSPRGHPVGPKPAASVRWEPPAVFWWLFTHGFFRWNNLDPQMHGFRVHQELEDQDEVSTMNLNWIVILRRGRTHMKP